MMYDTTPSNRGRAPEEVTIGTPGSLQHRPSAGDGFFVEHPIGMQVMLTSQKGALQMLHLPYPPQGRYRFRRKAPVFFEAVNGSWYAKSSGREEISGGSGSSRSSALVQSQRTLQVQAADGDYMLYAEEVNRESYAYHNYVVLAGARLQIGRAEDNDIIYPADTVSRHHASLFFDGSRWVVRDERSANGVFVNGYKTQEQELFIGDEICIMGLRLVIGCGFLSISDGNNRVRLRAEHLMRAEDTGSVLLSVLPDENRKPEEMFHRFPRYRTAQAGHKIEIESPPISMSDDSMPLLMRMGSSMIMGGSAALSGNVSMLAGSLLLPVLSRQYTKEDKEEYEKKRVEKYREYLDKKWQEIQDEKQYEESVLNENYPELSEVLSYTQKKEKLWERRKTDEDFLTLRLGSGDIPMTAEIEYARRRFELDYDPLMDEMYDLAEQEVLLENAPVLQNLSEDTVWGVLGSRQDTLRFAKNMILRLSLLYSYDEVKLVFLMEPEELSELSFVKYLPHAWDDQGSIRFVAADPSEAYQIGEHLSKSLGQDLERPQKLGDMLKKHPYYVVFAFSRRLLESMEVLKTAVQHEKTCGVSLIAAFEDLPKECSLLIRLNDAAQERHSHTVVYLKQLDRADDHFTLDSCSSRAADRAMRDVANTKLKLVSQAYDLPKTITFLEMYGAGRLEHLDPAKRWQENNPVKSLAVPVGVGTDGSLFMLDLHQKYQGPHGLVAGTTGSGKSEFLLTYILSLALNFHPDEVAFVLIDYKGGGLAGAFDDPANGIHLPHLLATITNLDGSAIQRSLISIQSEVMRRQRVFNQAKSAVGEGTMDIYTYQKLYRSKRVAEPMPHLFIISDEFAELKQQQPEFLDQLVSIARIGRSLGVHLILATQKPAGVVTDQIVSNTKFRVCLKVQERADSMDMLRRPEASELRETGRFYLQVGTNELFALGQSAWSGAEYEPQDTVVSKLDDSIQVIDNIGAGVLEIRPEAKRTGTGQSQLVAIVRMLTRVAKEQGIEPKALWLPPLAEQIDIASLKEAQPEALRVCAGVLDDPAKQAQHLLQLDLAACGNLLVLGGAGSGKTTFVQSLLYSLAKSCTPEQVNFYILDYSSRLLRIFGKLPHCGAVLTDDEDQLLAPFFKLIRQLVQERKALFEELEVDSFESACRIRRIPLILVVIDNLAALNNSRNGQSQIETLHTTIKNCANYGVRFVVTMSHTNEASGRIRQELPVRVVLHMKDRYDYSDALEHRVMYTPPDRPGRGLFLYADEPLEMQLAMFAPGQEQKERTAMLKKSVEQLCQTYASYPAARRIQVISEKQTYESFAGGFRAGRFPLGYHLKNGAPAALPMKQFSMLSLYFGNPDSVCPVLDNFLHIAEKEDMVVVFLKNHHKSRLERLKHGGSVYAFEGDAKGVEQVSRILLGKIGKRHELFLNYCKENGLNTEKPDIYLDVYDYMRGQLRPILFVAERYADLCEAVKSVTGLVSSYSSLYLLARRYQIYIIGCFYPEDSGQLAGEAIFDCFNPDRLAMLFGGMLKKQQLVGVPFDAGEREKTSAYNRCLMSYEGEIYPVFMPCGEQEKEELPEDDRPVFG